MKNTPEIQTDRLILRKFTEDDLPALFEIFQDEEVNQFLPWYPTQTLEQAAPSLSSATPANMPKVKAIRMRSVSKNTIFPLAILN